MCASSIDGRRAVDFCRIAPDVILGKDVSIHAFVNLYGCKIGDETKVGAFVEIQKNATIGQRCKISSHTFICEGVTIEDRVFVGHNVTFINDRLPMAINADGTMQTQDDWRVTPIIVRQGASIGSSVTLMCGITIGAGALIGAGSLVLNDVPDGEVWAGNPARFIRKIS